MKTFKQRMKEQMAARDRRIRELYSKGRTMDVIGKLHGISKARVCQIVNAPQ